MKELIFNLEDDGRYLSRVREQDGIFFEYCGINREGVFDVKEYVYVFDKDLPKLVMFLLEYINEKKLLE